MGLLLGTEQLDAAVLNGVSARRAYVGSDPVWVRPPTVERVGTGYFNAADQSSYTTTVDIGDAYPGKIVLILFAGFGIVSRTVSGVTLGGNAMTSVASINSYNPAGSGSTNTMLASGMYRLTTNIGGSQSLVVGFSGSMTRFICEVLTITEAISDVPFHTNTVAGAKSTANYTLTSSLNVPEKGVVIGWSPTVEGGGSITFASDISDTPWVGVTGRVTVPRVDGATDVFGSIAFDRLQAAATTKTMSISMPLVQPVNAGLSLASFR